MKQLFLFLSVFSLILLNSCSDDDDPTMGGTGFITLLEASNFITIVDENIEEGTSLGTIDARTNGGALSFTLDDQNPAGALTLNAASGELTVADASAFDFETNERITGSFTVRSDDESKTGTITINLNDLDESEREVWTGEVMTFSKTGGADPSDEANQDRITDNVWITRGNEGGQIYNAVLEAAADKDSSPADTEWAIGSIDDIDNLEFQTFRDALGGRPKNNVGVDLVVHLITDNIYLSLKITSWDEQKTGGFAYERSTM